MALLESPAGKHDTIVVRSARDGRIIRRLDPCASCTYSGLSYASTDGTVAFLARDKAKGKVMLMLARGAAVSTVATISGLASTPRFSPDGRRIAMLVTLGATKETGATQAGARQVGEIGVSYDEQRLAIESLGARPTAAITPLSPSGRYIYEYDWTPDSSALVVTSALGNGDANWWVAILDRVDATSGTVTNLTKPAT